MMERLGMRIWNNAVRMHPVSIGSLYQELLRQFLFAACFKACISGGSVTGIDPFNAFGFVYVSLPRQDASRLASPKLPLSAMSKLGTGWRESLLIGALAL